MDKTPIYQHSGTYAQEHGELEKYFASFKAHESCRNAIEKAIADNYHDNRLSDEGARAVIAEFGMDRTMYVLAATVRAKMSDGRIDRDNKEWAKAFPLVDDMIVMGGTVRDRSQELQLYHAHPGLIDLFLHQVRDEAAISRPMYKGTFDLAKEAGEVPEYRASYRANQLCQREIEQAVIQGWDGMHVAPDVVKGVLERFGPERVSFVLANTVQQKDWDERFSGDNRAWAKTVPIFLPEEKRTYCTVSSHSAKLDDFITVARKEMRELAQEQTAPVTEDKATALYERLAAEQEDFKNWLLTQPPEEILNHTFEYSVREDIVMLFDNIELSDAQIDALMALPSPLADIYKDFRDMDTGYMDVIRDCVEERADRQIKAQQQKQGKGKEDRKPSALAKLKEKAPAAPKPPTKRKTKSQER